MKITLLEKEHFCACSVNSIRRLDVIAEWTKKLIFQSFAWQVKSTSPRF